MIAMTRKPGDRIRVGDAVIKVVSTHANKVKLTIDAPKSVAVRREKK